MQNLPGRFSPGGISTLTRNHTFFIGWHHHKFKGAQPGEGLCHLFLESLIMFADASRQGNDVYSSQSGGHGANALQQGMSKHSDGKLCIRIPLTSCFS
jgi:hypothetical protein